MHRLLPVARRHRPIRVSGLVNGGFSYRSPYSLRPPLPVDGQPSILRPCITPAKKYGNINPLSIDYAFRPRLRSRLTLGGRALPRKPWTFGGRDSHPPFRYSCLHDHSHAVHPVLPEGLRPACNALLPLRFRAIRGFGSNLSPDHFRRGTTRPVSYYALFK